jgi:hypothetical protein
MGNFYSTLLKNYKLFLHRIFPDDEDATVDKRKVYYTQERNNERSKQSRNRKKMRISQVKKCYEASTICTIVEQNASQKTQNNLSSGIQ